MYLLVLLLSIVSACLGTQTGTKYTDLLADSLDYGYSARNGPSLWGSRFDSCGTGSHQSPVNLVPSACVATSFMPLDWQGHWDHREEGFSLRNTGHTAEVEYPENDEPVLRGGPLTDDYVLAQVHFHWGAEQSGSEHSLSGQRYGMEAHLVHFRKECNNIGNASQYENGLVVVGIFFETVDQNNTALEALVSGLGKIHEENDTTSLPAHAMAWLEPHSTAQPYYNYQGSLTTPPCSEIVTWIVLQESNSIGAQQVAEFQRINGHNGAITENCRPVQPINGRPVFYCNSATPTSVSLAILAALLLALIQLS